MANELIPDCAVRFNADTCIQPQLEISGEPGRVTALFGPSGSGKTTCLRLLAGLLKPDSGTIRMGSEIWVDSEQHTCLPPQHRGIGFLFQSYALFPHLSVRSNLAYGLSRWSKDQREHRVKEIADLLEISELLDHMPSQISGGETQRVALGRAVAPAPKWLFLDEPLSALDTPLRSRLGAELRRLLKQLAIPAVVVTHDRVELSLLADDLAVIDRGIVLNSGPVENLLRNPGSVVCAQILGEQNILSINKLSSLDQFCAFEIAGHCLRTTAPQTPPSSIRHAVIRSAEIALTQPGDGQASNHLRARLAALQTEGPLLRLQFDLPFPLVVHTTPQWVNAEQLTPGCMIDLSIPHTAIALIPQAASENKKIER